MNTEPNPSADMETNAQRKQPELFLLITHPLTRMQRDFLARGSLKFEDERSRPPQVQRLVQGNRRAQFGRITQEWQIVEATREHADDQQAQWHKCLEIHDASSLVSMLRMAAKPSRMRANCAGFLSVANNASTNNPTRVQNTT